MLNWKGKLPFHYITIKTYSKVRKQFWPKHRKYNLTQRETEREREKGRQLLHITSGSESLKKPFVANSVAVAAGSL